MKVVILAGGYGTRISEESHLKPKPMVEIGGHPILWHIMKHYSAYGLNDFVICAGYKQEAIKEYFSSYYLHHSDVSFDFSDSNRSIIHSNAAEPWRVVVVDTGLETMTGGRVKRIRRYVGDETFMLTYGDAVSDVDIRELAEFHKKHGKMATITAVGVSQRFGLLEVGEGGRITSFREKPEDHASVINGGFMVLNSGIFDLIEGDGTVFERFPLEAAAGRGELYAYRHYGFWQCMDTLRDKLMLDDLLKSGRAPWVKW
jgi:glucose-1-phosphate cytidylyltransferase